MWVLISSFWDSISGSPGAIISMFFAGVSGLGAGASGYFAWKAQARKYPICEVKIANDSPWKNWTVIQLGFKNKEASAFQVLSATIPTWRKGLICRLGSLETTVPIRQEGFIRIEGEFFETRLPDHPPQSAGQKALDLGGFQVSGPAETARTLKLVAPDRNGAPCIPSVIIIRFRWNDYRQYVRKLRVHT